MYLKDDDDHILRNAAGGSLKSGGVQPKVNFMLHFIEAPDTTYGECCKELKELGDIAFAGASNNISRNFVKRRCV